MFPNDKSGNSEVKTKAAPVFSRKKGGKETGNITLINSKTPIANGDDDLFLILLEAI